MPFPRSVIFIVQLLVCVSVLAQAGFAQVVVGSNVSIVASDPYSQKQVEVDASANPLNPNHVFAGYIDYQTVVNEDPAQRVTSKGLCGFSFSTNGGKTWRNGLVPLVASTVNKCGDPSVAWDTNGHVFYFALTELTDGVTTLMTVWRFTDPNDGTGSLNYDFQVQIDSGSSSVGQVLDKTALFFQPDATPGGSATAPGVLFACYTNFDGKQNNTVTKVVCAISQDGGGTYSKSNQSKFNGTINSNNGIAAAAGPNGSVYLFWRAFSITENGYYMVTVAENGTATQPFRVVGGAGFYPYDAPTLSDLARSNAFPSVASDGNQQLLLTFQAYSDPNGFMGPPSKDNTPRIFVTYSSDGGVSWSRPKAVDYGPHKNTHQFMPRAAYAGGVWSIIYYDARYDGCFEQEPANPLQCGRDLNLVTLSNGSQAYLPTGKDRRFDLRVVQGQIDALKNLNFTLPSTQVTLYFTTANTHQIVQRDSNCPPPGCPAVNYPFLPVAAGGLASFMGDYIAHIPKVQYVRNAVNPSLPAWRLANQATDPHTFLAFWADFRGVAFPLNGSGLPDINGNWTQFTPAGFPSCINPNTRDVNVMFSEINNSGLAASVRSTAPRDGVQPEMAVHIQNLSGREAWLRLEIVDTALEDWSMAQSLSSDDNSVDVKILKNSSVTKTVYYRSFLTRPTPSNPVFINIYEIDAITRLKINGGLSTGATYAPSVSLPLTGAVHGISTSSPSVVVGKQTGRSFTRTGQPSNNLIENNLIENNIINNNLIENNLIENNLIENNLIENSLIEDQQVTWTVTGGGALATAGTAFSNVANGQDLLLAGWKFQLLLYETQVNPKAYQCILLPTPTDVVLSNIAITTPNTNLIENLQVSNNLIGNNLIENNLIENSPIEEQVSNATFSVDSGERVNIALRAFKPLVTPLSMELNSLDRSKGALSSTSPIFDPNNPNQLGEAVFGQALNPGGILVASFFDTTPPEIFYALSPAPNAAGWNNTPVTLTWSVRDAQSGIVLKVACVDETFTTEGTFQRNCNATNGKGMTNTVSVVVKIDLTKPVITASRNPAPNANGWNNTDVTVSFTCSDSGGSGIALNSVAGKTVTTSGADQSVTNTGVCVDAAGNAADPVTVAGINIDKIPPTITLTAPGDGSGYLLNSVQATSYACTDSLSGVASCAGSVASGSNFSTANLGPNIFSVTATDKAGNATTMTSTYYVIYNFNLTPPKSPANLGSAIPLIWTLKDANGVVISAMTSLVRLTSVFKPGVQPLNGVCPVVPITDPGTTQVQLYSPATGATGGSDFRFTSGTFKFNWDTKSALATGRGCYTVVWQLLDNSGPAPGYSILNPSLLKMIAVELR